MTLVVSDGPQANFSLTKFDRTTTIRGEDAQPLETHVEYYHKRDTSPMAAAI